VAAPGEPFRLFFTPEGVRNRLQQLGFKPADEMGPEQLNEPYFKGRRDDLKIRGGLARLRGDVPQATGGKLTGLLRVAAQAVARC
jgi:hypothetical protein